MSLHTQILSATWLISFWQVLERSNVNTKTRTRTTESVHSLDFYIQIKGMFAAPSVWKHFLQFYVMWPLTLRSRERSKFPRASVAACPALSTLQAERFLWMLPTFRRRKRPSSVGPTTNLSPSLHTPLKYKQSALLLQYTLYSYTVIQLQRTNVSKPKPTFQRSGYPDLFVSLKRQSVQASMPKSTYRFCIYM